MTEYELLELILEFERSGVEYGQYIMTGMFAFIVTIFVLGQRMTRLMVILISIIYSAYVLFLTAGVAGSYYRASELAASFEDSELAATGAFSGAVEGYAFSGIAISMFWLISYVVSIVFVVLVRRQKFVAPNT